MCWTACPASGAGPTKAASGSCGDLYMASDERYVYFMADIREEAGYRFDTDTLLIPIDTIARTGEYQNERDRRIL